jgi:hypothetical protein
MHQDVAILRSMTLRILQKRKSASKAQAHHAYSDQPICYLKLEVPIRVLQLEITNILNFLKVFRSGLEIPYQLSRTRIDNASNPGLLLFYHSRIVLGCMMKINCTSVDGFCSSREAALSHSPDCLSSCLFLLLLFIE